MSASSGTVRPRSRLGRRPTAATEAPRTAGSGYPRWASPLGLVLVVAGLADASYLTAAHYTTAAILACSGNGLIDCTKVTTSSQSVIFGIPVAVLGLAYFLAMAPLQLPAAWRARQAWVHRLRLAGVTAGIGMVVYLVYTELFTLDAICLYCTAVHAITLLLFVLTLMASAWRTTPQDS